MTRLYLSGPISSPNPATVARNKAEFRFAQYFLAKVGIVGADVVNPVDLCADIEASGLTGDALWAACMRRCIRELTYCGGIVMLPGWEESRGAIREQSIAIDIGMPVHTLAGLLERERKA